jgi:hypothetical protein
MTENITNFDMNCTGYDNTWPVGLNCFSKTNIYNGTILDGLQFLIAFPGTAEYITFQLSSLSKIPVLEGLGVYLIVPNNESSYQNTIILGTPVYDSFLTQMAMMVYNNSNNFTTNSSADNVTLWVNNYANYTAYIGNATYNISLTNPFLYIAPENPSNESGLSTGALVGIIVGVIGLILILVGAFFGVRKYRSSRVGIEAEAMVYSEVPSEIPVNESSS